MIKAQFFLGFMLKFLNVVKIILFHAKSGTIPLIFKQSKLLYPILAGGLERVKERKGPYLDARGILIFTMSLSLGKNMVNMLLLSW